MRVRKHPHFYLRHSTTIKIPRKKIATIILCYYLCVNCLMMKQKKILLLVAVEAELGHSATKALSEHCDVRFIGMGKIQAFENTLATLMEGKYDCVINAGTCGSFRHPFATILRPAKVAQGDVYIDPASIFYSAPEYVATGSEGCSIASSDNFIGADTPEALRRLIEPYDCMDMESYAITRAIKFYAKRGIGTQPVLYMIKVVSDGCDGTIGDWQTRIEQLRPTLLDAIMECINNIEA